MDSNTVPESDMSLKSRSFLHRENDWVRKMPDQSSKDASMGKNYSDNLHSIKNTGKDLTMKQMFDISEKLIAEQSDEIYGVNTMNWEDSSWKHLSLIGDEEVINLLHTKVYVFSDSVLCLGKMNENPQSNTVWEDKLTWFKSSSQYNFWTQLMVSRWNSGGIFSQDSPHCSSATKTRSSCQKWAKSQNNWRIIFMSMFNDISWGSKDNEQECELNERLVSIFAKRFHQEDGHSSDLDQKRSGIPLMKPNHKEIETESQH